MFSQAGEIRRGMSRIKIAVN